jgi:hypothetical protein
MSGIDQFTKLLLHGEGADTSQTIVDSSFLSPKTMAVAGHVQIDTAKQKFGASAILFDGNTDDILYTADHPDFEPGAGNFTIDFWTYQNAAPAAFVGLVSKWGNAAGDNEYELAYNDNNNITFYHGDASGNGATSLGWVVTVGTGAWHHIALVRNGNVVTLYLDGVSEGDNALSITLFAGNNRLDIGRANHDSTGSINGWIDEFRFSKGIARWTANFTPPTRAYTTEGTFAGYMEV